MKKKTIFSILLLFTFISLFAQVDPETFSVKNSLDGTENLYSQTGGITSKFTTSILRDYINSNGVNLATADLTFTTNRSHSLNGNTLSFNNNYAAFINGNNGLFETISFEKIIGPNDRTIIGIGDFGGFGQDVDQVILGRLNTLGQPTTNIYIQPTTGIVSINSVDDIKQTVGNDLRANVQNNISYDAEGRFTANSTGIAAVTSDTMAIMSANANATVLGSKYVGLSMEPLGIVPGFTWEYQSKQEYAYGVAVIDGNGRQISNLYGGILDDQNIITDISRVEASIPTGTSMTYMYDQLNGSVAEFVIRPDGKFSFLAELGEILILSPNGQVNIPNIQIFADDSTAGAGGLIEGDLYTDPSGILRVKL